MRMKIKDFTLEKIGTYVAFFCGLFVLLPFKLKPLTVFVFFVWSLFSLFKNRKTIKIEIKTLIIGSIFFISYAVSLLFSENIQRGFTIIIRCIPIVLIPLGYSFLTLETKIIFNKLFRKTFIIAASIYSSLLFIYLFQLGYSSQKLDLYTYYSYITYEFWGLNEHPIYSSIFFSIALFFILIEGFKNKIFNSILFLILIFGLLILSRKGVIASFFVLSGIFLFLKKDKKYTAKLVFVFIGLFLLSLCVTEIRGRFLELFDSSKVVNNKETSTGIRYILWNTSEKVIQNSNYLGYGIGDAQEVLSKQLALDGYDFLSKENYNAHNQFLQIAIATGVIGVCLYFFSLLYFIQKFIKRKNPEAIVFLLFFIFVFLFESVLERQNGIIIYSFISSMFIYSSEFDKNSSK
ncbi:O-antigen ligase [Flavobacterium fryxellicola]|nr:O-antigen ligase [Flavobacterium fryxellicola]